MDLDELLRELDAMDEEDSSMEEGKAAYEYEKGKQAGEMAEGELDEMELDEILAELEKEDAKEGVDPAAVPVNPLNLEAKAKAEEAKKVEEKKVEEKKMEEGDDEEEVTELTVDELKDLIRDVLADVLGSDAAAEDEVGAEEDEIEVSDDEKVSDDMELEAILRELDKKEEGKMEEKKDVDEAKKVKDIGIKYKMKAVIKLEKPMSSVNETKLTNILKDILKK